MMMMMMMMMIEEVYFMEPYVVGAVICPSSWLAIYNVGILLPLVAVPP
jgi:hypothetical protein